LIVLKGDKNVSCHSLITKLDVLYASPDDLNNPIHM
jgi:hypothetical protein